MVLKKQSRDKERKIQMKNNELKLYKERIK
jgi:hypothetical protein